MNISKTIIILLLTAFKSLPCFCQSSHNFIGKEYALKELNNVIQKQPQPFRFKEPLLKDEKSVTTVIEPILFNIYGKDKIMDERPYEIYLIDHYWVAMGTLPKGYLGGTFLVIIDANDCRVLKITHGK